MLETPVSPSLRGFKLRFHTSIKKMRIQILCSKYEPPLLYKQNIGIYLPTYGQEKIALINIFQYNG